MKKVTLTKDVLTPENGVGHTGQTVAMTDVLAKQYISRGWAEEAAADAEALPPPIKPVPTSPITSETVKEDKGIKARETKETK